MDPQQFDRLVRGFSHTASRRRALGGLLGGALATVAGASMSEANRRHRRRQGQAKDQGGNSDCAHFCQGVFPPGPDRGRCISDAAHHQGACADCAGDTSRLCCTPGTTGAMCDPSRPIACCPSDQICQDGICVTPPTCAAGSCTAGGSVCTGQRVGCSATDPGCFCQSNVEGDTVCLKLNVDCRTRPTCSRSGDCPAGQRCFDDSCACGPGSKRCYPCCGG